VLQKREETDRVYTFLAALNPSYEDVRAQVLLSTEKLKFDAVTALIRQEVTRQVAMGTSDSNPKSEAQTFTVLCSNTERDKAKREIERCAKRKDTHPTNAGYYTLI
jgi:hypothetical protein